MSVRVSIIIKALNEQVNIERTLQSALIAASTVDGEVILADSYSTDDTIKIAKQFPIKIVQLANPEERSCGIGAQLGYQYAKSEFIYILDADMEINVDFLSQALELMAQDQALAGVGGIVQEMQLDSLEFQARVQRESEDRNVGEVNHLAMGGLYRKSAIVQVGYLTNRNLHSYEEFELGIRLRTAGWKLKRVAIVSVKHYGHTTPAFMLLGRRWATGYTLGIGELVRSSLGKPHMKLLLNELRELKLYIGVTVWWILLGFIVILIRPLTDMALLFLIFLLLPLVGMVIKKKSILMGIYSVISWQYYSAGLILGFCRKQICPSSVILSNELN